MPRTPRSKQFDPRKISVFHCINRCVRQCFLCGEDSVTGKNYDHRKQWIEDRAAMLAQWFAIDVIGISVMSNHFHLVLKNRPDVVDEWSDEEVARRWLMICPVRKQDDGSPETPSQQEIDTILNDPKKLAKLRKRLSHISWFMGKIAGPLAVQANAEDGASGAFWQGRYRSIKLIDPVAILVCLMYVDLNPIRAGLAKTPEESAHTSAKLRIQALQNGDDSDYWLAPLPIDERSAPGPDLSSNQRRCSDKGVLNLSTAEYLQLLDWTGRQVAAGKTGAIPADLEPILARVGLKPTALVELTMHFSSLFFLVAGTITSVASEAASRNRHWFWAPGSQLMSNTAA